MKFRATRQWCDSEPRPIGPWRRRYSTALADAREGYREGWRDTLSVEDSRGRSRELSNTQHERARAEHAAALHARDDRGVWG